MQVMDILLVKLDIAFINEMVIPTMKNFTAFKQDLQSRQAGFQLVTKIVLAHRLRAFESEMCYQKLV